jgi:K+-sensing histidine kinase KdpD
VAVGVDRGVTIPNLSLVFVVPVVIAGVGFGLGSSLCSAILGALAYNFFLTEPRYSLVVDDPANIWAIGLLFGAYRERHCLHLPTEGNGFGASEMAGDGAARL